MQKYGYYQGIPGFLQVYPQNTGYFADFADLAAKCIRTRFGFREAGGIPYHFLISAGLGFESNSHTGKV